MRILQVETSRLQFGSSNYTSDDPLSFSLEVLLQNAWHLLLTREYWTTLLHHHHHPAERRGPEQYLKTTFHWSFWLPYRWREESFLWKLVGGICRVDSSSHYCAQSCKRLYNSTAHLSRTGHSSWLLFLRHHGRRIVQLSTIASTKAVTTTFSGTILLRQLSCLLGSAAHRC